MFYVFSFPPGVYVGTLNLIASIPGLSILTLYMGKSENNGYFGYCCSLRLNLAEADNLLSSRSCFDPCPRSLKLKTCFSQ